MKKDEYVEAAFSIRGLLRNRQALLVHFNTPQSWRPLRFPEDLRNARNLKGEHLAFSTIRVDDRGPCQVQRFEDANAGGSVGLIFDIEDEGSVVRVCPDDGGTGESGEGFGDHPSESACVESIDRRCGGGRAGNNEWRVQNYKSLGLFIFEPIFVFGPSGDYRISLPQLLAAFPEDRIFRNGDGAFQEYDRAADKWRPIAYCDIVPC
jgi:hypothetical protein